MATSLYKAQVAQRNCEKDTKQELHAYCETCGIKICPLCIKEDHSFHNWETLTDLLTKKKVSFPKECREIRKKQLPGLKKEMVHLDEKIKEEDAIFGQKKLTLNCSRKSYIDTINKLFDNRIDECKQNSQEAKEMYRERREGLKQKVGYLEKMTTSLDKDINTFPDHDILDMEKEMRNELEQAYYYSTDKYTCTSQFVPGQLEVQVLENMIGIIHKISVEEKNEFDANPLTCTPSMRPISDTHAWVKIKEARNARLLDIRGREVVKTMKTGCTDLIISKKGEFVLSDDTKFTITVLTQDEQKIRMISTKPLHPTYICETENDDILVTFIDDYPFNFVKTSRRIVQRMSLAGKVIHTYEFMEDGKTRLFAKPNKLKMNKNTDICVVNWIGKSMEEMAELVVLHKDGRLKFTYREEGIQCEAFAPNDVECDSKCRILFTEYYSSAVHMLNSDGMYISKVCKYEQIHPISITIHNDNLWCGFQESKIKVYRYKN